MNIQDEFLPALNIYLINYSISESVCVMSEYRHEKSVGTGGIPPAPSRRRILKSMPI